jgi:hypothetical protein
VNFSNQSRKNLKVMIKRLFLATLAASTLMVQSSESANAVVTYRVVGTGDSILNLVGTQLASTDRWFDTEPGRQPYLDGIDHRYSTAAIWPELLSRSRRGGWVVIQDNPAATVANTTPEEWRTLLRTIVQELPDDRCVAGVLPYFQSSVDPVRASATVEFRNIMVAELNDQPCYAFILWDVAAAGHPEYIIEGDGQHPSPAGATWLANELDKWIGYRK